MKIMTLWAPISSEGYTLIENHGIIESITYPTSTHKKHIYGKELYEI